MVKKVNKSKDFIHRTSDHSNSGKKYSSKMATRRERRVVRDTLNHYDMDADSFVVDELDRKLINAKVASSHDYDWGYYCRGCPTGGFWRWIESQNFAMKDFSSEKAYNLRQFMRSHESNHSYEEYREKRKEAFAERRRNERRLLVALLRIVRKYNLEEDFARFICNEHSYVASKPGPNGEWGRIKVNPTPYQEVLWKVTEDEWAYADRLVERLHGYQFKGGYRRSISTLASVIEFVEGFLQSDAAKAVFFKRE